MFSQRQCKLLFSASVVLFLGSILIHIDGSVPSFDQNAQATESVPPDPAAQRMEMIEELRSIGNLLAKADARGAQVDQERQQLEQHITQEVNKGFQELIDLLQSGKVKVQTVSASSNSSR